MSAVRGELQGSASLLASITCLDPEQDVAYSRGIGMRPKVAEEDCGHFGRVLEFLSPKIAYNDSATFEATDRRAM
jgi:hypothetical protein